MSRPSKYSPEFRERAVRLARESQSSISQVARDLGMHAETLRLWVRPDEADDGSRANEILKALKFAPSSPVAESTKW
jgi:transposase